MAQKLTVLPPPMHPHQSHADQDAALQPKIGEILVQENFISPVACKQVLTIQEEERKFTDMPFLRILEESGRLSGKNHNRLLALPDIEKAIAKTALSHQLLTAEQLDICLQSRNAYQNLPDALVAQNILSNEDVATLIHDLLDRETLATQAAIMGLVAAPDIEYAYKVAKAPRSFGEICCSLDLITPLDLYHLLQKYDKQLKLGKILIHLGYTDEKTVASALEEQQHSNRLLGDILIGRNAITPSQCQEALSLQANIPFDPLSGFNYDGVARESLPRLVSARYAEEHLVLPIALLNRNLQLALIQPEAIESARELMSLYKHLQVHCTLVPEHRFFELFAELYGEAPSLAIGEALLACKKKQPVAKNAEPDFMRADLDENLDIDPLRSHLPNDSGETDVEEALNYIVRYGIDRKASDIHLEQQLKGLTLRYRIDGVIKDHCPDWLQRFLSENAGALIARLKVMANLDTTEKRIPQDGIFRISYLDQAGHHKSQLEFRVAACPTVTGESITIHILDPRKAKLSLRQNGHSPHVLEPLARHLTNDACLIIVAGPNGSGKSSTLYGALKLICDPSLKIITAEDPIEYNFPGIIQTQVNRKLELDFPQLLHSFALLDPDIIMVGELRDRETASLAFDAAQSGQLVLSSLYANDSLCALYRLLDLGIDRSRVAANLSCALGQRLVRKICPTCLSEYQPDPREWSQIFNKYPGHLRFFAGTGCESCDFTGFKGRTVLSEIWTMNSPQAFFNGANLDELRESSLLRGMKTMLHDGLLKLHSTTLPEICRVLPFEMLERFRRHESQTIAGAPPSPHDFLVADPTSEKEILTAMLNHFNTLLAESGHQPVEAERFSAFIHRQFHAFCTAHGCRRVLFTMSTDQANKVEILARADNRGQEPS